MTDWLQKKLIFVSYLIVFLIPILYFGKGFFIPYTTSKTFFFYGITEILFLSWLYLVFNNKKYWPTKKTLFLFVPFFFLTVWLTLTGVWGINPEMSFWSSLGRGTGLITYYHCLALSLVLVSLIANNGKSYLNNLLFWFINGSFFVTLSVWLAGEGLNLPFEFLVKSKGGGLIGNSSLTAGYLIFAFFFGLFLLFDNDFLQKKKKWVGVVLTFILFSPLFLNLIGLFKESRLIISARGSAFGLVCGLGISVLGYFLLSPKKNTKFSAFGVLTLLFFGSVVCWFYLITPGNIINRSFTNSATASRLIFWDIAKKGIAEKSIFGWGPENYGIVYQKYFDPEILKQSSTTAEIWVDRAHNIFFEMGLAGGWPAIIFYYAFLFSLFYYVGRAFAFQRLTRWQAGILWGIAIGYVLQNLFVFDSLLSLLGLTVLFSLIVGLNSKGKISDSVSSNNLPVVLKFLVIFGLGLILFFLLREFVFLPYQKVRTISRVVSLPLNKRPSHYADLLNISPVGDGWEVGGIAEDACGLYVKNLTEIRKDEALYTFAKKDLEKMLEYFNFIKLKEPYDSRLRLSVDCLSSVYAKNFSR